MQLAFCRHTSAALTSHEVGAVAFRLTCHPGDKAKLCLNGGDLQKIMLVVPPLNMHGRGASRSGRFNSSREACSIFRPKALDDKY